MKTPFLVVAALVVLGGCEDLRVPIGSTPDQLLPLRPVACQEVPPDVSTPVKLLLAVDVSGSMQFTDQNGLRIEAIKSYVASLDDDVRQNMQVATFGFGTNVLVQPRIEPSSAFFEPLSVWTVPAFLGLADVQTDHGAVYDAMFDHILLDALNTDPAELARTRYVIVVFTDGSATPVCCNEADQRDGERVDAFGCAPEPFEEEPAPGVLFCGSEPEQTLCNDQAFIDRFRELNPPFEDAAPDYGSGPATALPGLIAGGDHNRPEQLAEKAAKFGLLRDEIGIGGIDINVAFLFDDNLDEDVRALFGLNRCRVEHTAEVLAGPEGNVVAFSSAADIDFSVFRADPLCPIVTAANDCENYCLRARPQLIEEFGLAEDVCADPAIVAAGGDCAACEAAFADALGLLADVCPPS